MTATRICVSSRVLTCGLLTLAFFPAGGCSKRQPAAPAAPAKTPAAKHGQPEAPATAVATQDALLSTGKQLYANYCAACHGDNGDGNGQAAKFLYPKPRSFREAKFRLVTTTNRVPSDDDLLHTITRGMPGSAMLPFAHLSESDRRALVAYARHLTRTGVEERLRQVAAQFGETVDPKELADDVERVTGPGPRIETPAGLPAPGSESVARGRELYVKRCATCHGDAGKGDGVQEQRDDDGTPTSPRDYTRGIFKGGRETEQLYARTLLGMPGTPMPGSSDLKAEEIGDLVHYIQSLSDPAAQVKVEHKRTRLVAKRAAQTLPDVIPDTEWDSVPAASIVVSPLWWRNYDDPDLQIQVLHDGQSLAIRLSWNDATQNYHSVRPQDFKDMAAVQLFKPTGAARFTATQRGARPVSPDEAPLPNALAAGSRLNEAEPFLGMGSTTGTVDFWVWEADAQADLKQFADVDSTYPNLAVDEYPFETPDEDAIETRPGEPIEMAREISRPHPAARQPKDFLTGLAVGNLRSDPNRGSATSGHQAKGFGTLTMLPRPSQLVTGHGQWSNGRWTVVLRRPLAVAADAGLTLAPGDKLSIAFAIWDGAVSDRNGQKLVSIWHDLELER